LPICHGPAVLLDQQLGRELGGAVEGPVALHRKALGDATLADARKRLRRGDLEAPLARLERDSLQRLDRVDAAGGEEQQERAPAARRLQAVIGALQVGGDQVARVAVETGEDRGLRRALDDRLGLAGRQQVLQRADVAVAELHGGLAQPRQVQLAAAPAEVVERHDGPVRAALRQAQRDTCPDEAGSPCDQNSQPTAQASIRARIQQRPPSQSS
jgi:hypothetical protein